MRVVALLRGVNTGGVRFPMKELAAALTEAGHGAVRTVLASGNVVLEADSAAAGAAAVHDVVRERFGFDLAVVAVPVEAVRAAVAAYPFARGADRHAYVVFATDPSALPPLLDEPRDDDERVAAGDGVVFWDAPKGRTLDTAFGKRLGRRVASGAITTRNLNTLEKVLAAS